MSVDDGFPPDAPTPTYVVEAPVTLSITVHDRDALERVIGAGGDEWRSQFYRLTTTEDVLEHWTYNAVCNGVQDVSRLEGWADLPAGAVTLDLEYGKPDVERRA